MKVVPRSRVPSREYLRQFPPAHFRIIVFDLETTGLHSDTSEVIEIGAIEYMDSAETRRFHSFACPSKEIQKSVTAIHGYTAGDLQGHPKSLELLCSFIEWVGSFLNTSLVAHNLKFDLKFLESGIEILNRVQRRSFYYPEEGFCTYLFIRKAFGRCLDLSHACRLFNLKRVWARKKHGGLLDAELTAALFFVLKDWRFLSDTAGVACLRVQSPLPTPCKKRTLPWDSQLNYFN